MSQSLKLKKQKKTQNQQDNTIGNHTLNTLEIITVFILSSYMPCGTQVISTSKNTNFNLEFSALW